MRSDYKDCYFRSFDDLKLHYRDYPASTPGRIPLICLPGFSRSAQDFDALALHFANHKHRPRRVIVVDYRGRGLSAHAKTTDSYRVDIEMQDLLALATVAGVEHAGFVCTSRGGMIAMIAASARPALFKAIVLNDIGPVIDIRGILRIKQMVSNAANPRSWEHAAEQLKLTMQSQFPGLNDSQWEQYARATYFDDGTGPKLNYDKRLNETLSGVTMDTVLPDLWGPFQALGQIPVLTIRGEHSDVLSQETVDAMQKAKPDMEVHLAENQGHAPMLIAPKMLQRISTFFNTALGD